MTTGRVEEEESGGAEALTNIQPVSASQRVQATSPGLDDVVAPTVAVVALP